MRLVATLLLAAAVSSARDDRSVGTDTLFNTDMYVSPAKGESPSKGEWVVFHEGEGKPGKGYFMEHAPGEIAEFRLFVPKGLKKGKLYPLLIVYHGGKDGASGKGIGGRFARLSTRGHPLLVLSPNMYTLDSLDEILAEKKYPIDPRRIVVFGHSSGGMGVHAAFRKYLSTRGEFLPAMLIASSTTAFLGRVQYPPVPYVVIAGERETPEFVKHELLKTRRSVCRKHAVAMQQLIREVRYIEMKGIGHSSGKPEHDAVLLNLIRALPEPAFGFAPGRVKPAFEPIVEAAEAEDWTSLREAMIAFDDTENRPYETLRKKLLAAMERWLKAKVKVIGALGEKSSTLEITRGLNDYDRVKTMVDLFADTPRGEVFRKLLGKLETSKHLQRELDARRRYYEIVGGQPSETMIKELRELRAQTPRTEFGWRRAAEKLLALQG